MFGWLKKRAQEASTDAMRNDLVRFISGLKGADAHEISTMLVVANSLRINLSKMGKIPPAALDFSIPRDTDTDMKCDMCAITLGGFIKQFQGQNQPTDAFGVMIWLHSVRALNVPEIRALGREMWAELVRGFDHVDDAVGQVRSLGGSNLPSTLADEVRFIPRGLEPFRS